jgi:hypothetical protein
MPTINRKYLQAAQSIHRQSNDSADELKLPALPAHLWQGVVDTAHRAAKARAREWHNAARIKSEQLLNQLEDLQHSVNQLIGEVQNRLKPRRFATPTELYRDLVALEQEPFEVKIELDQRELCVTTEPIELEGIYLGRFEIRLDWQRPQSVHPYTVVALEPNPAAANESVTHPHVNDQVLCEGDGRACIGRALAEGRLYDFFTIVDRLLHTYAPGRAYAELDQWHGTPCHDCGGIVDEDDYCTCGRCDEMICLDCSALCSHCDQSCCGRCIDSCQLCDQPTCGPCLNRCRQCRSFVCPDCLTNNLCTQCHEEPLPNDDDFQNLEESTPAAADVAVYSDGLGETVVPA